MYLFHNALKNVTRNKGRYILMGGIITVILITVTISTMINSTTKEIINDYVTRFNARVFFTQDLRKVMQLKPDEKGLINVPPLTTTQLLSFADSDYVGTTVFTGSVQAYGDLLQGIDQEGQGLGNSFTPSTEHEPDNRQIPNCVVLGYSDYYLIEDFKLGQRIIETGRIFEKQGECVVSMDFSELNNLSVGDKISIYNVDYPEHILLLNITGIYLDGTTAQTGAGWAVTNRRNEILVNYETLVAAGLGDAVYTQATYYLKSPEYGNAFEIELREKGLPEVYLVNIDSSNYNQIVEPVKGLSKVSGLMLLVVLAFGGSIVVLLSVLSVRERKYEIGVLRAMGMEKGRVAAGMLIESLAVISICLILGLGVGTSIAQSVSNNILDDQIKIAQDNYTPFEASYGSGVTLQNEPIEMDYTNLVNVSVKVTPEMLLITIAIALSLGIVSNSAGILYITRFEPIRILSERD